MQDPDLIWGRQLSAAQVSFSFPLSVHIYNNLSRPTMAAHDLIDQRTFRRLPFSYVQFHPLAMAIHNFGFCEFLAINSFRSSPTNHAFFGRFPIIVSLPTSPHLSRTSHPHVPSSLYTGHQRMPMYPPISFTLFN